MIFKLLNRLEEKLAVALLATMSILVFSQVVLRFGFGLGFGWIDEVARIAFIWVVFLGAVVGVQRHLHLRVTVFQGLFPAPARKAIAMTGELLFLAFCLAMTWHSVELVMSTLDFPFRLPSTGVSMFWAYMILPISFGLQAIRLVARHVNGDGEADHV